MKKAGQRRRNASDGLGGMNKQVPLAPRERRRYKASICASRFRRAAYIAKGAPYAPPASRDCFAILNWHISPGILKRDLAPPEGSRPELLIFPDPDRNRSFAISGLSDDALDTNQYLGSTYIPRISNNASVVAIAQDGGIAVFGRK